MELYDRIQRLEASLADIERNYAPALFSSSFGAEDMVLTDIIAHQFPRIKIFTLDTGRLPEETHRLIAATEDHYKIKIRAYFPDATAVEHYVQTNGTNAFYDSVALRKQCCHIRKVEPLKRALAGAGAWITGLRREQAPTRKDLLESAFDAEHGLQKVNPLLDWLTEDVWAYIRSHAVPFNELHERGYPSIGCAPCTRAVRPGEDIRAGRWWWENPEHKECGLHAPAPAGKPAGLGVTPARVSLVQLDS